MVFSSLLFLFRFLPIMLICYFAAPKRFRNGVLFIGSLFFYGWGEPVYISLLLFSTIVDFVHGKVIGHFLEREKRGTAIWVLWSSVCVNLGLLIFFKYSNLSLTLPVGISFYTFQTMSYTIDVYRGHAKVQNNIIDFGAYVSMFPQLIAGPIVRYNTIEKELKERRESYDQFERGILYFVTGLAKKVLIANQMGVIWNEVSQVLSGERTILLVWVGILSFAMQIYFDFSGYSDMAVGLGHMMGFHFPENFRYPYVSKSITEFWRRWHISLGTWFKEYVYIPLGGNQKGMKRQVVNILIVWLLTGIWHGAGWNFLIWGLYFGCILLLEKLVLWKYLQRLPGFFQHMYALLLIAIGWVLFAHDQLQSGLLYLGELFGMANIPLVNDETLYLLMTNFPLFLIAILGCSHWPKTWYRTLYHHENRRIRLLTYSGSIFGIIGLMIIITAYLVDASYNPFLYFRF